MIFSNYLIFFKASQLIPILTFCEGEASLEWKCPPPRSYRPLLFFLSSLEGYPSASHFAPNLAKALHCECDQHATELHWFQAVLEHPHLTVSVKVRGGCIGAQRGVSQDLGTSFRFQDFSSYCFLPSSSMAPFSLPTSVGLPDCPLYRIMLNFLLLRGKNKLTSFF